MPSLGEERKSKHLLGQPRVIPKTNFLLHQDTGRALQAAVLKTERDAQDETVHGSYIKHNSPLFPGQFHFFHQVAI